MKKFKEVRRDVLAIAVLSVLALLPLLAVLYYRHVPKPSPTTFEVIAAAVSPDGLHVASLQYPKAETEEEEYGPRCTLVVRRLGSTKDIVRQPFFDNFGSVRWDNEGNTIVLSGDGTKWLNFLGGPTPQTLAWNDGTRTTSLETLALSGIQEYNAKDSSSTGYMSWNVWILPDSDFMIGRQRGGIWTATDLFTGVPLPTHPNLDATMIGRPNMRRFAPRPRTRTKSAAPPVQLAVAASLPQVQWRPTPLPNPTPIANLSQEQREFLAKEKKFEAELDKSLAILWGEGPAPPQEDEEYIPPSSPPSDEEINHMETRVRQINVWSRKERQRLFPGSKPGVLRAFRPPPTPTYSKVGLYDVTTGKLQWKRRLQERHAGVRLLWSGDGKLLAVVDTAYPAPDIDLNGLGDCVNGITILNGHDGRTISTWPMEHATTPANSIQFSLSPQGDWQLMDFVFTPQGKHLRYFDVRTGKILRDILLDRSTATKYVREQLATDQTGRIWAQAEATADGFIWTRHKLGQLTAKANK